MKSQRQGIRSTKQCVHPTVLPTTLPQQQDIYIKTYDTRNTLYTDQTGKFPHVSSRGFQYQMFLYHVDSNSIWVEPTKNKTEGELILARSRALLRMKACGITPRHQVLDNEASADYIRVITEDWKATYQLVPPDIHRRNLAERAIQTFKAHFLSILAGISKAFPNYLWDKLLPQTELTINLLRQSHIAPDMSAWEYYNNAPFNFDATPIGPCGCPVIIHNKPNKRASWALRRICYPGDVGTKTAPLELVKLMINSVLSRQGAKFCTFDISNFYLQTPLDRPEYIKIKITDMPVAYSAWIFNNRNASSILSQIPQKINMAASNRLIDERL